VTALPQPDPTPRAATGAHAAGARARLAPPHLHDVVSADGTRLRAWDNGAEGPTVVLCNGLGTSAYAWPTLLDPDCGVRVVSWMHRGVGGSDRPREKHRAGIDTFVEDALAVMEAYGVERAPFLGWSMGVNTMFELALHHPEKVAGLFAVAGVPGRTFSTMLRPLGLPPLANEAITTTAARGAKLAGPLLNTVTTRVPVGPRTAGLLARTGFMLPGADPDAVARAVRDFLTTPVDWYMHLALHTHRHQRVPLSRIDVPAVFVAGSWDILAGAKDMRSAAERMKEADYHEFRASHFVQMEHAEAVHALLLDFVERVG